MTKVSYSLRMELKVKKRLDKEARSEKRSAAFIVQQALERYLDAKEYKRECLRKAFKEAEKGVFISEAAMDRWFMSLGTENELPPPAPDIFPGKTQVKERA